MTYSRYFYSLFNSLKHMMLSTMMLSLFVPAPVANAKGGLLEESLSRIRQYYYVNRQIQMRSDQVNDDDGVKKAEASVAELRQKLSDLSLISKKSSEQKKSEKALKATTKPLTKAVETERRRAAQDFDSKRYGAISIPTGFVKGNKNGAKKIITTPVETGKIRKDSVRGLARHRMTVAPVSSPFTTLNPVVLTLPVYDPNWPNRKPTQSETAIFGEYIVESVITRSMFRHPVIPARYRAPDDIKQKAVAAITMTGSKGERSPISLIGLDESQTDLVMADASLVFVWPLFDESVKRKDFSYIVDTVSFENDTRLGTTTVVSRRFGLTTKKKISKDSNNSRFRVFNYQEEALVRVWAGHTFAQNKLAYVGRLICGFPDATMTGDTKIYFTVTPPKSENEVHLIALRFNDFDDSSLSANAQEQADSKNRRKDLALNEDDGDLYDDAVTVVPMPTSNGGTKLAPKIKVGSDDESEDNDFRDARDELRAISLVNEDHENDSSDEDWSENDESDDDGSDDTGGGQKNGRAAAVQMTRSSEKGSFAARKTDLFLKLTRKSGERKSSSDLRKSSSDLRNGSSSLSSIAMVPPIAPVPPPLMNKPIAPVAPPVMNKRDRLNALIEQVELDYDYTFLNENWNDLCGFFVSKNKEEFARLLTAITQEYGVSKAVTAILDDFGIEEDELMEGIEFDRPTIDRMLWTEGKIYDVCEDAVETSEQIAIFLKSVGWIGSYRLAVSSTP